MTFDSWDEVVAFALVLPDTALESFYGTPCPKVNGKAFVAGARGRQLPRDEPA